jgi:hypothetical protein
MSLAVLQHGDVWWGITAISSFYGDVLLQQPAKYAEQFSSVSLLC